MLFGTPPPTGADLHFRLFDIPIRVSPLFWLTAFILGIHGPSVDPGVMLMWVLAVFISVVLHEMGHALMARKFGHWPSITLHGLGGYASYSGSHDSVSTRVKIVAAGPAAGFVFAAVLVGLAALLGQRVEFRLNLIPVSVEPFNAPPLVNVFYFQLLVVNILWGIFNLMPIYPLDGGQITRTLWVHNNPWDGLRKSLIVSIIFAAALAVWSLLGRNMFLTIMLGLLAYDNYNELMSISGRRGRDW